MTATLYTGDALSVLKSLPDGIARCCVTSPPYWGLRDYGQTGQLGLERTPEEYEARMVEVFREVRRVLTDDGTLWLNLGDSYAGSGKGAWDRTDVQKEVYVPKPGGLEASMPKVPPGCKPKDLVGIPWSVAFALRADGWYLRSEIIWAKPNPMPESVTDRPTKAHEQIFLLSKSPRYYWDGDAIAEPAEQPIGIARLTGQHKADAGGFTTNGHGPSTLGSNQGATTRNTRSVWTIPTTPYPGAHFATFPEELARRCILAGTSQRGGCPTCGKPWERVTERTPMVIDRSERTHPMGRTRSSGTMLEPPTSKTVGWAPTCEHGLDPVPDVVIDPFGGSGTVAAVAVGNGRSSVYIDLNPEYLELARHRIGPMLCVGVACG